LADQAKRFAKQIAMTRFWKKFLREGQRLFGRGAKPQIWLGAFGKHPGWDDHIDDIGLETESLLLAKQILYVDGIGGQIDSGEWERLDEAHRLREFKHDFLWKRGEAFLMGRIWSSRDGKNRTKYPLVVCAHCLSLPLDWALTNVSQCVDGVERQCKSAQFADEVRGVLRHALDHLRRSVAQADGEVSLREPDARTFVGRLGLKEEHEGLYRIVYCVHTQLARYLADARAKNGSDLKAGQVRLPAVAGLTAESFSFWSRFLESQLGRNVPVLLTLPAQESWVDATCGEPASKEFYSLRAKPDVLALASEVAWKIPDEFRKAHSELVEALIVSNARSESGPQARSKKWFA
jgi:hypothetical protein